MMGHSTGEQSMALSSDSLTPMYHSSRHRRNPIQCSVISLWNGSKNDKNLVSRGLRWSGIKSKMLAVIFWKNFFIILITIEPRQGAKIKVPRQPQVKKTII